MLQVKNLEFGFSDPLVRDFNFYIPAGKLRLLLGPSGCGKSTLLAILSGTANDNLNWNGHILLNGISIGHLPANERKVGLIFQDPLLFPHMTVGENLAFGLPASINNQVKRKAAVRKALQEADLEGFADRDPSSLSGGQKARVALMRALLANPRMLLLDEAFSSLDPKLRKSFGRFVASQIVIRKIPALLVSHDLEDKTLTNGSAIRFPT